MTRPTDDRGRRGKEFGVVGRALAAGLVGAGVVLLVWAAIARPGMTLAEVVPEIHTAIEGAQVIGWVVIGVVGAIACARQRARRGVMLGAWLGALALLCGVRELDLHVILNPSNIHLLGLEPEQAVRFRVDWWTDPAVHGRLRLAWGGALLAIGALVIVPFALAAYPWGRRMLRREPFAWLVVLGLGLLVLAYGADDLLRSVWGRGGEQALARASLIEELIELAGQALVLAGAALLAARRVAIPGTSLDTRTRG